MNYDSIDDLIENNVIYINTDEDLLNSSSKLTNSSILNFTWANIKIEGPSSISIGDYNYEIKFISSNKSNLDYILPNHEVSLSNRDSANSLNVSNIIIANNIADLTYSAIREV